MQLLEIFKDKSKLKKLEEDVLYGGIGLCFVNESGTQFNKSFTNLTESFNRMFFTIKEKEYYQYFVDVAEAFYKENNAKLDLNQTKILAYPSNFEGIIHKDHNEDCLTTITFLNSVWDRTWGGEILCYSDDLKIVIGGVTPEFGKTFAFNGKIPHRAIAPIRVSSLLRIVLVTKGL